MATTTTISTTTASITSAITAAAMVNLLPLVTGEKKNWIGLEIRPPPAALLQAAESWKPRSSNHPFPLFTQGKGTSTVPHHITIVYGFDPKYYDEIARMVNEAHIIVSDLHVGVLYEFIPEDKQRQDKMFLCAKVTCEKVMDLKKAIRKKYVINNPHETDEKLIEPHITFRGFSNAPVALPKHSFLQALMEDRLPLGVGASDKLSFKQMNRVCLAYWASQAGLDLRHRPADYPPPPQLTEEERSKLGGPLVTLDPDEPQEIRDYLWIMDQLNEKHKFLCDYIETPLGGCNSLKVLQQLKDVVECIKGILLIPISMSGISSGSGAMVSGYQSHRVATVFARHYFVMYGWHHPRANGSMTMTTNTSTNAHEWTKSSLVPVLTKFDDQVWESIRKALLNMFDSCYDVIPLRKSVSNLYVRSASDIERTSGVFIRQNQEFLERVVRQALEELSTIETYAIGGYPFVKTLLQTVRTYAELDAAENNKWKGIGQQFGIMTATTTTTKDEKSKEKSK